MKTTIEKGPKKKRKWHLADEWVKGVSVIVQNSPLMRPAHVSLVFPVDERTTRGSSKIEGHTILGPVLICCCILCVCVFVGIERGLKKGWRLFLEFFLLSFSWQNKRPQKVKVATCVRACVSTRAPPPSYGFCGCCWTRTPNCVTIFIQKYTRTNAIWWEGEQGNPQLCISSSSLNWNNKIPIFSSDFSLFRKIG